MKAPIQYLTESSNTMQGSVSFRVFVGGQDSRTRRAISLPAIGIDSNQTTLAERVGSNRRVIGPDSMPWHHEGVVNVEDNAVILVEIKKTTPSSSIAKRGWAKLGNGDLSRTQSNYLVFVVHHLSPLIKVQSIHTKSTLMGGHPFLQGRMTVVEDIVGAGIILPTITEASIRRQTPISLVNVTVIQAGPENVKAVMTPATTEGQKPVLEFKHFRKIRLK
jgi:hypothetical protein